MADIDLISERLEFYGLEPSTKKIDSVWYHLYLSNLLVNYSKEDVDKAIKKCFNFRTVVDCKLSRELYKDKKNVIKYHNGMILIRVYDLPEIV